MIPPSRSAKLTTAGEYTLGYARKMLATRTEPFAARPRVFVAPVDYPLAVQVGPLPPEALRGWNVVHRLAKLLSPAAEAFRYFVLEHGEDYLCQHFGWYLVLAGPDLVLSPARQPEGVASAGLVG